MIQEQSSTMGFSNPCGANNCFINVFLQVLMRLGTFRSKFAGQHVCRASCLICGFKVCTLTLRSFVFTRYSPTE
jgi:hypothetical protein